MTNEEQDWATDGRLDIMVLGPMSEEENVAASCLPVREALEILFNEVELLEVIQGAGIGREDCRFMIPEAIGGQDIIEGVFSRLDVADLVIFNLSPKGGKGEVGGNVLYELGLTHALGIPALFVLEDGDEVKVPFYARQMKQLRVSKFTPEHLAKVLRPVILEFLRGEEVDNQYLNDRVTQFYKSPMIDISATAGLAAGYYYNFLSRLIREGGYPAKYPEFIQKIYLVLPDSIRGTYQSDVSRLKKELEKRGIVPELQKLPPIEGDDLGAIWFDHVEGCLFDIPRTIYPLRLSPRLMAFEDRHQRLKGDLARKTYRQRTKRLEANLLAHFQGALEFQIRADRSPTRRHLVEFVTLKELPSLISDWVASKGE